MIQLVPLQLLLYRCFKSWLNHCLYHCFDAGNDQDLAFIAKEYTPQKHIVVLELCQFAPFQGCPGRLNSSMVFYYGHVTKTKPFLLCTAAR